MPKNKRPHRRDEAPPPAPIVTGFATGHIQTGWLRLLVGGVFVLVAIVAIVASRGG